MIDSFYNISLNSFGKLLFDFLVLCVLSYILMFMMNKTPTFVNFAVYVFLNSI